MIRYFLIILQLILLVKCSFIDKYQYSESAIRVNQVGYFTSAKKIAVLVAPSAQQFVLRNLDKEVVYTGEVLEQKYWGQSGESVSILDFSEYVQPGTYYLSCGEVISPQFQIRQDPYIPLVQSAAKAYYFNRATTALEVTHAASYKRPFSHPDTSVYVHASVVSEELTPGMQLSTPYGWYDAGDYNKYVVNSGITTYTLLTAYEHNKELFDTLRWNIPESTNGLPDLLDEILWNVRWLETMQDPADGGVFHKTTTANFEGFVSASEATGKRFVVAKGTAAALNFGAVLAKTSRIIRPNDQQYADTLLAKAKRAWDWAQNNPKVIFKNPVSIHPEFPAITTGEYGDAMFTDEFYWAGVELFLATGDQGYMNDFPIGSFSHFSVPTWNSVETLGLISLASSDASHSLSREAADKLMLLAEQLISVWREAPYRITLNRFAWGSNSDILNQGMVLINAYRVFGNVEYFEAALSGLDYVLGRNATGYCFVTGFGTKMPMNIHHRQSAADDIAQPIPGLLVGGPNPRNVNQDCGADHYPVMLPARCYIDEECSYSTNEVAINWNAPLVYMSSSLQKIYFTDFRKIN